MPEVVPNFTLKNQNDEEVCFYDALEETEQGIIIFAYPKANTPGCTRQACGFRDCYEEIKQQGYEVYGISRDKPTAQANWKESKHLPYDLFCEADDMLKELGCLAGSTTTRSVFVIDRATRSLVFSRIKISPEDSVNAVLKMIQGDESSSDGETENEDQPETKAKSKAKAKAKSRGRPPVPAKKEEGVPEKKNAISRRGASKRPAEESESPVEKKVARASSSKKSVKRSGPSGLVESVDSTQKRQRKASKEDVSKKSELNVSKSTTGRKPRPTSQPAIARASGRSHGAIDDVTEKASKETKGDPKASARKPATNVDKSRSQSIGASKRGKK